MLLIVDNGLLKFNPILFIGLLPVIVVTLFVRVLNSSLSSSNFMYVRWINLVLPKVPKVETVDFDLAYLYSIY